MELNGKCKEEFEKWYLFEYMRMIPEKDWTLEFINQFEVTRIYLLKEFYKKKPSEKYGVYEGFFNSLEYEGVKLFDKCFSFHYFQKTIYQTHYDIVKQAIEKANEIYNK